MKLIKKSVFERKYSFVLKYIDIQGIELASGERALLNFFSWIYFVPKFTQIMREEKKEKMDFPFAIQRAMPWKSVCLIKRIGLTKDFILMKMEK